MSNLGNVNNQIYMDGLTENAWASQPRDTKNTAFAKIMPPQIGSPLHSVCKPNTGDWIMTFADI